MGAGRMASAMVGGLLSQNKLKPESIACTCGKDSTGPELAARTGIRYVEDAATMVSQSDVLVLACKPQQFNDLPAELTALTQGKLIVSILAGTPLARLQERFSQARNLVRAMPNTPGQIGAGITAYTAIKPLSADDLHLVEMLLGSLGETFPIGEEHIDAVTAVSGSGPAYIFEFTAALREAAIAAGLPAEIAHRLAIQTVYGSARLMVETGIEPVELRKAVTSPGGTTQAALESMETDDFRGLIRRAVLAAQRRSRELAKV